MAQRCARRSPLARSGLTQAGRSRAELGGSYFQIDERDIADLILFGRRYARHIQYYNAANEKSGDWSAFFDSDVSANLAALAKLPVDSYVQFQRDLETWLKADPHRDAAALGAYFKLVFHLPLALLQEAGAIIEKLPAGHPMAGEAMELARRELGKPLGALIGWYKGATDPAGAKLFTDVGPIPGEYKISAGDDPRLRLSSAMQAALLDRAAPREMPLPTILVGSLEPGNWAGIWDAATADAEPYAAAGPQPYEQIYDALDYDLFESAIRDIYQAAARLKRDAAKQLRDSLEQWGGHTPHYGLWLAFLRLFKHAQGTLNGFTDRHLDFYFHDVLRLRARAAVADRVHLVFELAKGVDARRIPAGTAFRAGNDALGKPVTYALDQELIANRGRIVALSAVRVDRVEGGEIARAASDVRSLDGAGKKPLPADKPDWAAFGPAQGEFARVGFAVADRKLFLREGTRTIRLQAALAGSLDFAPASDAWSVRLTGPEGWWQPASGLTVTAVGWAQSGTGRSGTIVRFELKLPADAPAVVPFDPKLHGEGRGAAGPPRMEFTFDFTKPSAAAAFEQMGDVEIDDLLLDVGASGLKQLSIIAGGAPADPSKPFAPFGAQPRPGSALMVGSAEIFSKSIASLSLSLDWQLNYDPLDYFRGTGRADFKVVEAVLQDGQWQYAGSHALFGDGTRSNFTLVGAGRIDGDVEQTPDNPSLGPSTISGFLRLTLNKDFGHADYPLANARALVQLAKEAEPEVVWMGESPKAIYSAASDYGASEVRQKVAKAIQLAEGQWTLRDAVPRPPYDPIVTRIDAEYQSTTGTVASFSHLHPFGTTSEQPTNGRLFPPMPFSGALMIGLAEFKPPARLSLLFQVADGTGSPLKMPPPLKFEYLAGDAWTAFEPRDVDDKTANLAGSGLIGLAVPEDADQAHAVMTNGLHWVRLSADGDTDAFNHLLSIDAQAGRAVFVDAGNDPRFLATPLPPNTISKLLVPDPAIKKVRQPYSSFGGRPTEAADAFATRVSERLRHKDRAVASFDYEALILEAFPQLYRAKCLPTTLLERDAGTRIIADNEVAPGAVTVVTVPRVSGQAVHNPLRPYADQGLLAAVDRHLRARISPFVRLEVQNPKFEEVRAAFKVRFHRGIADIAFYKEALNEALVAFLTPWSRPDGGEIMFGGRLWKSSLVDFIEERPEVDFVTDFHLYHKPDADAGSDAWTPVDVELVEATTARSILVSAQHHVIDEVTGDA